MLRIWIILSFLFCFALSSRADTPTYADKVTGDWDGERNNLVAQGVDLGAEYMGDLLGVVGGGVQRSNAYLDYLDMHANFDMDKLVGLQDNKARLLFLNDIGGTPNTAAGTRMGIDNNETFPHRFQLAEAWDEQQFFDGKVAVLAGFIDMNDDFNATAVTNNFLGPSFQLNDEIAQTAVPTFPANSLAVRATVKPTDDTYLKAALFQATPAFVHTTDYHVGGSAGAFFITEAGWQEKGNDNSPNKIGVGGWTYTNPSHDQVTSVEQGIPSDNVSHGGYLISSYRLYEEDKKNLTGFFRPGIADNDTHSASWAYTGGVVGTGWVPGRDEDDIGLGIEQTHQADKFIEQAALYNLAVPHNEYTTELYYRAKVFRGTKLQPDFQYVANPANGNGVHDAVVLALRLDADF